MAAEVKTHMTAAEFWAFAETTDQRLELIHGEVIVMATPIPDHQAVVLDTALVLKAISKSQGGRVFIAPLEVYLDEANIPQPDVMWVAANSRCVIGEKRLEGPPDLVVEVFSPSTAQHDKVAKFRLYQKHGVPEYWMIDPTAQYIEVWQHVEGQFRLHGVFVPGETFTSPVLGGQTVSVSALFGEE